MSENQEKPKEIPAEEVAKPVEPSKLEEFAKTSIAAKLSGKFHETAGTIKKKVGEVTDNPDLINQGRKQVVIGRVHRFVGALRSAKEGVQAVGVKLMDDVKKVFED